MGAGVEHDFGVQCKHRVDVDLCALTYCLGCSVSRYLTSARIRAFAASSPALSCDFARTADHAGMSAASCPDSMVLKAASNGNSPSCFFDNCVKSAGRLRSVPARTPSPFADGPWH